MGRSYAEAMASIRVPGWRPPSPTERAKAEAEAKPAPGRRWSDTGLHGRTPRRDSVCVGKIFKAHPDAGIRALAAAQAREQHELNDIIAHGEVHRGPCPAKACRGKVQLRLSLFAKNDHTHRIAMGEKRQARIRERGW